MKTPFEWDAYSDQPYQLKDKEYKKKMRSHELFSLVKTFSTALVVLPLSLMMMPFIKRKSINSRTFFSMGVDFEREPKVTLELLDELEVEAILVRLKLWEMEKLEELKTFLQANQKRKVILKIMQDREHIEDLELSKKDLQMIFTTLDNLVDIYEIGTSINRSKWGFFSVDEYLRFYQVAYDLRQTKFPQMQLIGSGVIDFEFHFTAHTLFHTSKQRFDGVSSLLYVDRRGAPENLQMGFDLADKIALLSTMVWLSPKSGHSLHITETNWPLKNTAPYAPTSEHECVSEELYSDYLLRYHLLSFASQQVGSVSWHQLIAPGYGLVDNREGIIKRTAFDVYKTMVQNLKNAQFLRLDIERGYYIFQCLVDEKLLQIHWSLKPTTLQNEEYFDVTSSSGILIEDKTLTIGSSPLYIHIKNGE